MTWTSAFDRPARPLRACGQQADVPSSADIGERWRSHGAAGRGRHAILATNRGRRPSLFFKGFRRRAGSTYSPRRPLRRRHEYPEMVRISARWRPNGYPSHRRFRRRPSRARGPRSAPAIPGLALRASVSASRRRLAGRRVAQGLRPSAARSAASRTASLSMSRTSTGLPASRRNLVTPTVTSRDRPRAWRRAAASSQLGRTGLDRLGRAYPCPRLP